jgi:hypothetical protein
MARYDLGCSFPIIPSFLPGVGGMVCRVPVDSEGHRHIPYISSCGHSAMSRILEILADFEMVSRRDEDLISCIPMDVIFLMRMVRTTEEGDDHDDPGRGR